MFYLKISIFFNDILSSFLNCVNNGPNGGSRLNWSSTITANLTDTSYMFYQAISFNQNMGSWNTSKNTNMSYMFYGAIKFNSAVPTPTNSATNLTSMFEGATNYNNSQAPNGTTQRLQWSNIPNFSSAAPTNFSVRSALTLWNGTNGNSPFTTTGA